MIILFHVFFHYADSLPLCEEPTEIAKCGQPSSRGYYSPKYCAVGLEHYCPAMCGTCRGNCIYMYIFCRKGM